MAEKSLKNLLETQDAFSSLFFDSEKMSETEKIERHKTLTLALHSEISSLADAVHYKDHRPFGLPTQRQKILYESIDVLRYTLSILNLWSFNTEEIEDAFDARDAHLWDRETRGLQNWSGQPVVIFDVDDVIAQFRKGFFGWVDDKFGVKIEIESPEYYVSTPVGDMTNEEAFMEFINDGGIRRLEVNEKVVQSMKSLRDKGYWIHLLTARPGDNLKCAFDTYYWLRENKVPYDSVAMSAEKFRWLQDKDFYKSGSLICAIDDSPKHAQEYAQHGIEVYVPKRSYNQEVWDGENINAFDWWEDDLSEKIK